MKKKVFGSWMSMVLICEMVLSVLAISPMKARAGELEATAGAWDADRKSERV